MTARLKTRPPTGKISWPLILLAGEAGTGKSYRAAAFTGDERVGRAFFLDLGEGIVDEYINVPGAKYDVIDHDGTWVDIIGQVEAVRDFGASELAKGNKPIVLIVDSMTAEWAMLCAWTDTRARRSKSNKRLLAEDPDAEIDVTSNYWNDANSRHNRLMNILKTFPGIVVMTALETEKTQFGPDGRPMPNAPKVAKPDGQKRLAADVTAHSRLSQDADPMVVKLWSVKRNVQPGKDKPQPWKDFTLGGLVFDFLGLGADTAQVRDAKKLDADQVMPGERVQPDETPPPNDQGSNGAAAKGPLDENARKKRDAWTRAWNAAKALSMSRKEFADDLRKEMSVGETDATPDQLVQYAQILETAAEAAKAKSAEPEQPTLDGGGAEGPVGATT